jgi:hypothetical protein
VGNGNSDMTIIIEGAIALALVCNTARRDEDCFVLSSNRPKTFQVSNGSSLEEQVKRDLVALFGVTSVRVVRTDKAFTATVDMAVFDRTTRRAVYAKERSLNEKYPDYTFDVYLMDQSGITNGNAVRE